MQCSLILKLKSVRGKIHIRPVPNRSIWFCYAIEMPGLKNLIVFYVKNAWLKELKDLSCLLKHILYIKQYSALRCVKYRSLYITATFFLAHPETMDVHLINEGDGFGVSISGRSPSGVPVISDIQPKSPSHK